MNELIPPNVKALSEALILSNDILRNIELNELSLENIALKTVRLAILLNDSQMQQIMMYEVAGYPSSPDGVPPEVYKLAVLAGREYEVSEDGEGHQKNIKVNKKYIYGVSIRSLEESLKVNEIHLQLAKDPDVSVSSANPNQLIYPTSNLNERLRIKNDITIASGRLSSRICYIYHYVLNKYYELKFSGIADDIFSRIRERVDKYIGDKLPKSIQRFNAVYDNLQSDNPEDWSNAVHSCRRILQDLADIVFPATNQNRIKGKREISLDQDNYVNRLMAFVEDSSKSTKFEHLVGSHLKYLGERLDSIFQAAQKGSHNTITKKEEADRYVMYTYILVGDILSLYEDMQFEKK